MRSILDQVYQEKEIFVQGAVFSNTEPAITVDCLVPANIGYAKKPVPYVTAENYVRCLSQTSYLLSHYVLKNKLIPIRITEKEFMKAMVEYELYYRNLSMIFHKRVRRGELFRMQLVLKNFREIRRLQDFILFTFSNKRMVISGEMSFVFVV